MSPQFVSEGPIDVIIIIGSGNGQVQNRWQSISWTNNDKTLQYHMTSLGHNELVW